MPATNPQLDQLAARVRDLRQKTQSAVSQVVVGLEAVTDQLLMALLASGHVLLEGVPGTAKTTLCRTFSTVLGIHFERVQFTPDLLPSDVTGTQVLDRQTSDFVLRKGPVFCQLLLADELNRAPARTQSSLLEAMQERQVTIEGKTLALPEPFLVLATQTLSNKKACIACQKLNWIAFYFVSTWVIRTASKRSTCSTCIANLL